MGKGKRGSGGTDWQWICLKFNKKHVNSPFSKNFNSFDEENKPKKTVKISKILSNLLDYKLMVDHTQFIVSTSALDIISNSFLLKKHKKDQKLYEDMKKTKYKIDYKLYRLSDDFIKRSKRRKYVKLALKQKTVVLYEDPPDFYELDANNNDVSGANSPSRSKRRKGELLITNSYRFSYDYFIRKFNEENKKDINETVVVEDFNYEEDFLEIKVFINNISIFMKI